VSSRVTVSRSVLSVFIILIAIIGGLSGLQVAKLTRPPVTLTTTLEQTVYATVTKSFTQTSSNYVILNCISTNLGGGYTPGLVSAPDYFSIGFSEPGPGSLEIGLWGLNRAVTATVDYAADASVTSMDSLQFTIPAIPYQTYYSKLVPVPLPQGGTLSNATNVDFNLAPQPEGAGVVCRTLTWIPG